VSKKIHLLNLRILPAQDTSGTIVVEEKNSFFLKARHVCQKKKKEDDGVGDPWKGTMPLVSSKRQRPL